MTTRRTPGQAHARRVLCALARTALDVCNLRAEAGLEDDDRPRMWLVALERWTRDEEPPAGLAARSRALRAWAKTPPLDTWWKWAISNVSDAAVDVRDHPSHAWRQTEWVIVALMNVRNELVGGKSAAWVRESAAWVREVYTRHLRDVERDAAEAIAAARLEQAREDRAEAERVLGTVRP